MPVTPNQLIDQSTRHAVHLERLKSGYVNDYDDMLSLMEKRIIGELSGDLTDWNKKRLNTQLAAIRGVIKDSAVGMNSTFASQTKELAGYEVVFEVRSLEKVTVNYDFDLPSDNQVLAAIRSTSLQMTGPYQGALLDTYVGDWSAKTSRRVTQAVRLGWANGITTQQLVRDLEATVGGSFTLNRRDWSNIVRTSMNHISAVSREQAWAANDDIIRGVRIVATLDSRTSDQCRSLDGKVFPVNEGPRPPFHIGCRTTTAAAIDKRYSILEKDGTRSARDPVTGKVYSAPANQSYYGWLKTQPAAVQNSIVGPTRGKLLRNGGLTSERFAELNIGKKFQPMTLKEMRAMEPIAFKKANI